VAAGLPTEAGREKLATLVLGGAQERAAGARGQLAALLSACAWVRTLRPDFRAESEPDGD
jgi:hypothetical protein